MTSVDGDDWLSPSSRAADGVGPSDGRLLGALIAGIAATGVLSTYVPTIGPWWAVLALTTTISTGLVAVTDRDAWRIRNGMAYVALGQRAQWRRGAIPETRDQAAAWLEDAANGDATALERASVLMHLDRHAEAADLLDRHEPSTAAERARRVRMRALIDGQATGRIDMRAIRDVVPTLEPAEARYHLAAAAWSQAWLDIKAGREWRKGFASAVGDVGPLELPGRDRLWLAVAQLAVPIECLALLPILAVVVAVITAL